MAPPVAVVDIGTNSVRLLIAQHGEAAGALHVLDRRLQITRLGQGVDARGQLATEAIRRTADVLVAFGRRWREMKVAQVRITATSAARDAANADDLRAAVRWATGAPLEIISGEEEAALSFRGARSGVRLPSADGVLCVVDIGGGSTELITGRDTPMTSTSRQLGSVRLTERLLRSDPPTVAEVAAARGAVAAELDAAFEVVAPAEVTHLVGVAGTATTLAALHRGLPDYVEGAVHGTVLPRPALRELADLLLSLRTEQRRALGPVSPGRADVIHAGALILDAVAARMGRDVRISESDILDGLALDLLDRRTRS